MEFSARLMPSGASPVEVAPITRHDVSEGPVEGHYELPEGIDLGVLELTFSNYYSYLRSKTLTYRLMLPAGVPEPKPHIV